MATATITSQLTDTLVNPGSPTSLGTGNAQASETTINLFGTGCSAIGHSGSVGPTSPTAISQFRGMYVTQSITRANNHLHIWVRDLYPIRNKSVGGVSIYLQGTQECLYYVTGLDAGYGGGWFHAVINLGSDRPAADLGTLPSNASLGRVGYCGNISASKGEDFLQNSYFDAIRVGGDAVGVTFIGGTSGDRLTMTDCADADVSFYGCLRNIGGSLKIEGPLTFGTAAGTTYITDSLQTMTFTNFTVGDGTTPSVAADYYHIHFVGNGAGITDVTKTDVTWKGVSRTLPFSFDTTGLGTGDAYRSTRSTYVFGSILEFGAQYTSTNDVFIECDTIIPAGITLTEPSFANCDAVTLTNASDLISGGQTALHNTATSVAFITTNDFDKIVNHAFDNTAGTGWAIDLGTITATRSDTSNGNTFSGYSTTVNGNKAVKVHINTGVTYTINATNGSNIAANLVYNSGPGTLVVQNAVTIQVTVLDNVTGLAIQDARCQLYLTSDYSTSVLNGGTNASGIVSDSYSYAGDAGVEGWVRQFDVAGTDYIQKDISGTITSNGLFLTVRLDPY